MGVDLGVQRMSETVIIHATHYIINYHCIYYQTINKLLYQKNLRRNNHIYHVCLKKEIILTFTFQEDKSQVASDETRF